MHLRKITASLLSLTAAALALGHPNAAQAQSEKSGGTPAPVSATQPRRAPEQPTGILPRIAVGLKLGLSRTAQIGADAVSTIDDHNYKTSYPLGLFLDVDLTRHISLQLEGLRSSKGREADNGGIKRATFNLDYYDISLMPRISYSNRTILTPYLFGGLTLGNLRAAELIDHGNEDTSIDQEPFVNEWELGGRVGIGMQLATFGSRQSFIAEIRYDRGFTGISRGGEDIKNHLFAGMIGYRYSFAAPPSPSHAISEDRAGQANPERAERDHDGDGLLGAEDFCPKTFGTIEQRGCPEPDHDGDGLVDRIDSCPAEHGTIELHGCAEGDPVSDDEDV